MQHQADDIAHITNARLLDIGGQRQVVGGTLNGVTFYTPTIIDIDGDIVRTESGNFRISRSIH